MCAHSRSASCKSTKISPSSPPFSPSHSRSRSCWRALSLSPSPSHVFICVRKYICTIFHSHSLTFSVTHTHTHTLSLSLSLSLIHTHTHTHTHTHLSFSPSLPLSTRARILSLSLQYGQPVLTIAREKKLIEISKILMEAGALEDLKLEKIEDE